MKKYERLVARVEITRECRYNAEHRLERRNALAYYAISMLSLFVIVVSVLPNVHTFDIVGTQWLLLLTIINSVFIIITTLVDAGGNYSLNKFHMQVSGRAIDRILSQLLLATEEQKCDEKWLEGIYAQYQDALDSCPIGHLPVDYLAAQVNKPFLFENAWAGHSPARRLVARRWRPLLLYFKRGRWMIPHFAIFVLTCVVLFEIWNPTTSRFGLGLMDHGLSSELPVE